jgi:ATP-dependent Clp protease, protease subunit
VKRKRLWEIKQQTVPGILDLYIYGDVEGDRYNFWTDEVMESETSATYFREELESHPDVNQINIYINSYGGSVFEGTAIYNQLKRHPAHKTVYVDGIAASIASVIAMAGNEIVMPKNALMMVHNMWMFVQGNADELRKAADDLEKINEAGREAYLQKAGDKLTPDLIAKLEDDETWLTAEECIRYGLADRYAEQDADMEKASEVLEKAHLNLEQRIKFHTSLAAQLRAMITPKEEEKEPSEITQKELREETPVPNLILKLFERS